MNDTAKDRYRGKSALGRAEIDFDAAAALADLARIIEADCGPARGKRYACPFHGDGASATVTINPDGKHWTCWSCHAKGDALDWISRRDGVSLVAAARKLDPTLAPRPAPRRRKAAVAPSPARPAERPGPRRADEAAWRDPAWQAAADAIIGRAEETLWGPEGTAALDWLRARGLMDHTISRFRLGFLPGWAESEPLEALADRGGPRPIRAPRGVTIPWLRPGSWHSARPTGDDPGPRWVGCNVRRLRPDVSDPWQGGDKCVAFRGSVRGYAFPLPDVCPGVPALVLEGEWDGLLAWQLAGWVTNPITFGGAEQAPRPETLGALAACPEWLLAFDHDDPGDAGARKLAARAPHKAHRVWLPHGKDLGEFVQAGGDVLAWLNGEFDRLKLPWPLSTEPARPTGA